MSGTWKCVECGKRDVDVCHSITFNCYFCDSCYTDKCDAIEDERLQSNSKLDNLGGFDG